MKAKPIEGTVCQSEVQGEQDPGERTHLIRSVERWVQLVWIDLRE